MIWQYETRSKLDPIKLQINTKSPNIFLVAKEYNMTFLQQMTN